MKKLFHLIFSVLIVKEKRRFWKLTAGEALVSVLDVIFLLALLMLVGVYTTHASSRWFSGVVLFRHPIAPVVIFFIIFCAKNFLGFAISSANYQFMYAVASRISKDKLKEYLEGSYHSFVHVNSSVVNRRIAQQPIEFCHYVVSGVQQTLTQVLLMSITAVVTAAFYPQLFPILLLMLAPAVALAWIILSRKLQQVRMHAKTSSEKALQHLQEALAGFIESNVYDKKSFFVHRYHRHQKQLNRYLSDTLVIQHLPARLIELFAVFGLLVLVGVNTFMQHDKVSLVTVGALLVAAYKIIPGVVKVTNLMGLVRTYAHTATGLQPAPMSLKKPSPPPASLCSFSFDHVSFRYPSRSVFNDFSFCMQAGDMAGVAGLSGKGKTTFSKLLLGFLEPDAGAIRLNGQSCDDRARQCYWDRIAYVKQQPFLLHASIFENISFGDNLDKNRMNTVLSTTGLEGLLSSLPDGGETIITENGKNFSGGQRQRIVLARALYRDADLLILDEPFSELDNTSQTALLKHLQHMASEGKMIFLITHDQKALRFCTKQITLDEVES